MYRFSRHSYLVPRPCISRALSYANCQLFQSKSLLRWCPGFCINASFPGDAGYNGFLCLNALTQFKKHDTLYILPGRLVITGRIPCQVLST
jgi:hypothetical protein